MLRWRAAKAGGLNISDRNCSLPASPCSTRVLAAFFVVQHELQRHARVAGPARVRRVAAVAVQVARVGTGSVHVSCSTARAATRETRRAGWGGGRAAAAPAFSGPRSRGTRPQHSRQRLQLRRSFARMWATANGACAHRHHHRAAPQPVAHSRHTTLGGGRAAAAPAFSGPCSRGTRPQRSRQRLQRSRSFARIWATANGACAHRHHHRAAQQPVAHSRHATSEIGQVVRVGARRPHSRSPTPWHADSSIHARLRPCRRPCPASVGRRTQARTA